MDILYFLIINFNIKLRIISNYCQFILYFLMIFLMIYIFYKSFLSHLILLIFMVFKLEQTK